MNPVQINPPQATGFGVFPALAIVAVIILIWVVNK